MPEFLDRDYIFSLRMNELVTDTEFTPEGDHQLLVDGTYRYVASETGISHNLTPDVSGNFNTGRLETGAQFPTEFNRSRNIIPTNGSENIGYVGRGIYMTPGAKVRVPSRPRQSINPNAQTDVINQRYPSLSLEFAIKPLKFRKNMNVFYNRGALRVLVSKSRRLVIRPKIGGRTVALRSKKSLKKDSWYHVGMTFQPFRRKAYLYINGELTDTFDLPQGFIRFRNDIIIGPNNLNVKTQSAPLYILSLIHI